MDVNLQLHTPASLLTGKDAGTHRIGRWVGSRTGQDHLKERKVSFPCIFMNTSVLRAACQTFR
jgi:hypothetical protein